jgi:Protein of unknown function (DUF1329)
MTTALASSHHESPPPPPASPERRRRAPRLRSFLGVSAVIAGVGLLVSLRSAPPGLADGEELGPANAEVARGLLPEEILEHYRRGEYRNRVIELGRPGLRSIENPPDFQEASRANRDVYDLAPDGSIVEVATGRQPPFILGLPFPDVAPGDPEAAAKIVWNYFYAIYYRGDCHFLSELVMLGKRGAERRIVTDVIMRTYDGMPEARERENTDNLLLQQLATVVSPADLNGTISLTWRYRDPGRRDSVWTYVPGLRRVRQVSPLNRSDGFLGSDLSLDDGPFFDAKPEEFTYRLLGRQEQLVLVDPYSVRGEAEMVPVAGGGWRTIWKETPRIGADDPAWDGLPWAPVSAVLALRPVWIVEAVPKDPHYLYGRIVLRLDAETYRGSWATKYDRAGTAVGSYQVSTGAYYSPDGRTWVSSGGIAVQTAENLLYERATVVLFPPRSRQNPADWRVATSPEAFRPDALARLGR